MRALRWAAFIVVLAGTVYYGWAKAVLLVVLGAGGVFFGTMFFFALFDAIRTRNDPKPGQTRPQGRHGDEDDELAQLRHIAGL